MEHTTPTDTAAFIAETEAFIAAAEATDARIEALLATGSTAVRLADLALQLEMGRRELDEIEQEQAAIGAAIDALEAP
jgi:hypothetical protein